MRNWGFDDHEYRNDALWQRLQTDAEEIADAVDRQGYGHHSGAVLLKMDGQFYVVSGSGCSCGGRMDIDGPHQNAEDAIGACGQHGDDLRRHFNVCSS